MWTPNPQAASGAGSRRPQEPELGRVRWRKRTPHRLLQGPDQPQRPRARPLAMREQLGPSAFAALRNCSQLFLNTVPPRPGFGPEPGFSRACRWPCVGGLDRPGQRPTWYRLPRFALRRGRRGQAAGVGPHTAHGRIRNIAAASCTGLGGDGCIVTLDWGVYDFELEFCECVQPALWRIGPPSPSPSQSPAPPRARLLPPLSRSPTSPLYEQATSDSSATMVTAIHPWLDSSRTYLTTLSFKWQWLSGYCSSINVGVPPELQLRLNGLDASMGRAQARELKGVERTDQRGRPPPRARADVARACAHASPQPRQPQQLHHERAPQTQTRPCGVDVKHRLGQPRLCL